MKRTISNIAYILVIAAFAISCKRPYMPPAINAQTGYLVVEGVINPGNDSTKFALSRVVKLDKSTVSPVTGAQVTIESTSNVSYTLTGNAAGVYSSGPLNLSTSQKYRLHIKTSDGKDYQSDYVEVKITPAIDAINYTIKNNGLQISLNAHDAANGTRYYRWNYSESWRFHSKYQSNYVSNGDEVVARNKDQMVYHCYTGEGSTSILLGSSAQLTQDVIAAAPIVFIPSTSERIEDTYSILVNQYALTSDAYNFWQNLKKNTEQLGSIFDAQPSEITGNIHNTANPSEPVIGYVSVSTVQFKRVFISNSVLPQDWKPVYPFDCTEDSLFVNKLVGTKYVNQEDMVFNINKGGYSMIPISAISSPKDGLGHTGSAPICVDCTLRGSVTKPSFWP